MTEDEKQHLLNHVAGQTVVHTSPFSNLKTPLNDAPITQDFRNKYVIPIYMSLLGMNKYESRLKMETEKLIDEIDAEIISQMLGDYNWRTRSTGAYFLAIKNQTSFQDLIGNLLLKSELCYSGES